MTSLATHVPATKCERERPVDRSGGTLQTLRGIYSGGTATWLRYTTGRPGARLLDSDGLVLGRVFPTGLGWGWMVGSASGPSRDPRSAMDAVERFLGGG